MCDLKATLMNLQLGLIQELIFYKCKLGHNAAERTKNFCCMRGEGAVDYNTVPRWFEKFYSSCRILDDQARSDGLKTICCIAMTMIN